MKLVRARLRAPECCAALCAPSENPPPKTVNHVYNKKQQNVCDPFIKSWNHKNRIPHLDLVQYVVFDSSG